jgi:streptogrisin D
MRLNRPSFRAVAVAAVALTAGAAVATQAMAAPHASGTSVKALVASLGTHTGGTYLDNGRTVITVTDNASAAQVRAAGYRAEVVRYSAAHLHDITLSLNKSARIPGTAWSTDPRTNQVRVTADRTVGGSALAKIRDLTSRYGSAVTITRTSSTFRTYIAGGDAIWGSQYRCSLGFNVTDGTNEYFLTAGHCGNVESAWSDSQGGSTIAETQASTFPGSDYSIAEYTGSADHPSAVDLYNGSTQQITSAGDASVGESVQRSGSTSGLHSGTVTGLDATVNYSEGTVTGLIDTNVCAEAGDSGGALFDGSTALGLTSGGSGDCTSGGETFFQPVPEALSAYGVQIG